MFLFRSAILLLFGNNLFEDDQVKLMMMIIEMEWNGIKSKTLLHRRYGATDDDFQ